MNRFNTDSRIVEIPEPRVTAQPGVATGDLLDVRSLIDGATFDVSSNMSSELYLTHVESHEKKQTVNSSVGINLLSFPDTYISGDIRTIKLPTLYGTMLEVNTARLEPFSGLSYYAHHWLSSVDKADPNWCEKPLEDYVFPGRPIFKQCLFKIPETPDSYVDATPETIDDYIRISYLPADPENILWSRGLSLNPILIKSHDWFLRPLPYYDDNGKLQYKDALVYDYMDSNVGVAYLLAGSCDYLRLQEDSTYHLPEYTGFLLTCAEGNALRDISKEYPCCKFMSIDELRARAEFLECDDIEAIEEEFKTTGMVRLVPGKNIQKVYGSGDLKIYADPNHKAIPPILPVELISNKKPAVGELVVVSGLSSPQNGVSYFASSYVRPLIGDLVTVIDGMALPTCLENPCGSVGGGSGYWITPIKRVGWTSLDHNGDYRGPHPDEYQQHQDPPQIATTAADPKDNIIKLTDNSYKVSMLHSPLGRHLGQVVGGMSLSLETIKKMADGSLCSTLVTEFNKLKEDQKHNQEYPIGQYVEYIGSPFTGGDLGDYETKIVAFIDDPIMFSYGSTVGIEEFATFDPWYYGERWDKSTTAEVDWGSTTGTPLSPPAKQRREVILRCVNRGNGGNLSFISLVPTVDPLEAPLTEKNTKSIGGNFTLRKTKYRIGDTTEFETTTNIDAQSRLTESVKIRRTPKSIGVGAAELDKTGNIHDCDVPGFEGVTVGWQPMVFRCGEGSCDDDLQIGVAITDFRVRCGPDPSSSIYTEIPTAVYDYSVTHIPEDIDNGAGSPEDSKEVESSYDGFKAYRTHTLTSSTERCRLIAPITNLCPNMFAEMIPKINEYNIKSHSIGDIIYHSGGSVGSGKLGVIRRYKVYNSTSDGPGNFSINKTYGANSSEDFEGYDVWTSKTRRVIRKPDHIGFREFGKGGYITASIETLTFTKTFTDQQYGDTPIEATANITYRKIVIDIHIDASIKQYAELCRESKSESGDGYYIQTLTVPNPNKDPSAFGEDYTDLNAYHPVDTLTTDTTFILHLRVESGLKLEEWKSPTVKPTITPVWTGYIYHKSSKIKSIPPIHTATLTRKETYSYGEEDETWTVEFTNSYTGGEWSESSFAPEYDTHEISGDRLVTFRETTSIGSDAVSYHAKDIVDLSTADLKKVLELDFDETDEESLYQAVDKKIGEFRSEISEKLPNITSNGPKDLMQETERLFNKTMYTVSPLGAGSDDSLIVGGNANMSYYAAFTVPSDTRPVISGKELICGTGDQTFEIPDSVEFTWSARGGEVYSGHELSDLFSS